MRHLLLILHRRFCRMHVQEALTLAGLRHPCCVKFLGVIAQPPAIVTEYCARGSLADVLWQARHGGGAYAAALSWRRRLAIAVEAASGLVHLHSRSPPLMHRDLKSPNILVRSAKEGRDGRG